MKLSKLKLHIWCEMCMNFILKTKNRKKESKNKKNTIYESYLVTPYM